MYERPIGSQSFTSWSQSSRMCQPKGRCIIHDVDEVLRARADKRSKKAWMSHVAAPSEVANTCQLNQCTVFEEHKTHLENIFWRVWCATCAISNGRFTGTLSSAIAGLGSDAQGVVALGEKVCVVDRAIGGTGSPLEFNRIRRSLQLSTSGQAASSNSILIHLVLGRPTALVWEDRYQSNNIYIYVLYYYILIYLFLAKRWPRSVHICALILQGR